MVNINGIQHTLFSNHLYSVKSSQIDFTAYFIKALPNVLVFKMEDGIVIRILPEYIFEIKDAEVPLYER